MALAKLKRVAEEHPLFIILSVLMMGVGFGAAPLKFVESAKDSKIATRDAEIDLLEARLGAVTRTVGNEGTSQLQTADLLMTSAEAADLPASLTYSEEGDLYYPPVGILPGWAQTMTDEAGLIMESTPMTRSEAENLLGGLAKQPVFLWRSSEEQTVVASDDSNLAAFPYVSLERLDVETLSKQLEDVIGSTDLDTLIAEDPLGALFELNIMLFLSGANSEFTPLLSGIQRTEEALYAELQFVLRNVSVDGAPPGTFYIKRELIILADGDDLVAITTSNPSADRRGTNAAAAITTILSDLHVIV